MQISFADTLRIKLEAKKLGQTFPEKSHSLLLSEVAKKLFGLRSFHEFNKLRKKTIEQHIKLSGGFGSPATCNFCGFGIFCPDVPEDNKMHQARHNAFEEATGVLNYTPAFHAQREFNKRQGYSLLNDPDPERQVDGALEILRSWFDRSLEAAIINSYWKQHPKFEEYVPLMIGNNPHFSARLASLLEQQYGRADGVIQKGNTYWYPPKK